MTTLEILTPPGTGAIAVVALRGPAVWAMVQARFQGPRKLPDSPTPGDTYYGNLGDGTFADDVVLTVTDDAPTVEIHCHGGRQVVRWLTELFPVPEAPRYGTESPWYWLERACTLRTAKILLDQCDGRWDTATESLRREAAEWAHVGAHLCLPFTVAVAGVPNAGKSSLVNALTGYTRSVVDATPGTTRDVVRALVAMDGWPVELWDTAGLRNATDAIEAEGVELARRAHSRADAVLMVLDTTQPLAHQPTPAPGTVVALNKTDCPPLWPTETFPDGIPVSARKMAGVGQLMGALVRVLVPRVPPDGATVPFSPELARSLLV
jgi:tRNA modification GTPase